MNMLDNGAVLPFGLLSEDTMSVMGGFNKSYKNSSLRVGVVVATYPVGDENNITNLTTEYDVIVIEQNEDRGATSIRYRNCLSSEGFGSIADYFERTLRHLENKTTDGDSVNLSGQDGAIVLLLCLDSMSDKAVIVSSLTHPDRQTNLTDDQPYLEGEYNGVNIVVNTDGSTALTFKGATDNSGSPTDTSQGTTTFLIKQDGSFEFMHDAIDILADRQGTLTITTKKDCSIQAQGDVIANCVNATVTASGDAKITASGNAVLEGKEVDLGKDAKDAAILGDTFKKYFDTLQVATALGPSGPPIMPMPPSSLSKKVKIE